VLAAGPVVFPAVTVRYSINEEGRGYLRPRIWVLRFVVKDIRAEQGGLRLRCTFIGLTASIPLAFSRPGNAEWRYIWVSPIAQQQGGFEGQFGTRDSHAVIFKCGALSISRQWPGTVEGMRYYSAPAIIQRWRSIDISPMARESKPHH
jgi:hypothetical protein